MVVAHNLKAMNSQRQLSIVSGTVSRKAEKLSSGYRINRAADDAAGLAISEKMRRQVRGLTKATENSEDGISMVQIADGALSEVQDMLQRMNELCVQAANGTNAASDRQNIQDEISQLITEIDRVAETTKFNETYLLNGSLSKGGRGAYNQAINDRKFEAIRKKYEEDKEKAKVKLTALSGANAGQEVTAADIAGTDGLKIIYIQDDAVSTTQKPAGSATSTDPKYNALKTQLQQQIVPNAVKEIIGAFSPAFDFLNNSSIGIGLKLGGNTDPGLGPQTLAYVRLGHYSYADGSVVPDTLQYQLAVNVDALYDASGNLKPGAREELEVTIVHEMMHAFMDEALTNGMTGTVDGVHADDRFPKWFIEGMAQTAAGGYYNGNDWVNGGLGINTSTSDSQISTALQVNALGGSADASNYGTGYLASMYLGYLAGGKNMDAASMKKGLATVLGDLVRGDSLQDIIIRLTGRTSITDFESKFAKDADAIKFVKDLTAFVGNGSGGAVGNFTTVNDILQDNPITTGTPATLFKLDIVNDTVENKYPAGYDVFAGGTATNGKGSYNDGPLQNAANRRITGFGAAIHAGTDADMNNKIHVYIDAMDAASIGVDQVDVSTEDLATLSIERVALALARVSEQRSELGACQNRLEHTIDNLDNIVENTTAAESQIRDTDMAKEMVAYSNANILQQAGQAMLAQMNQSNQGVLSLIA